MTADAFTVWKCSDCEFVAVTRIDGLGHAADWGHHIDRLEVKRRTRSSAPFGFDVQWSTDWQWTG